jgi:hypothetical protein
MRIREAKKNLCYNTKHQQTRTSHPDLHTTAILFHNPTKTGVSSVKLRICPKVFAVPHLCSKLPIQHSHASINCADRFEAHQNRLEK